MAKQRIMIHLVVQYCVKISEGKTTIVANVEASQSGGTKQ